MRKRTVATGLAAALFQLPLHAQSIDTTISGMELTVGGFGTYGVVMTDTDKAQFIRGLQSNGASESPSDKVDSNLGVQATLKINSWLSATVQGLAEQRSYSSYITADTAWAYLKIDPIDNLSIKVGRVQMPLFAISDSREINYANTWIRPPNEVYGLANIEELNGVEASYKLPIGGTKLSLTGYGLHGMLINRTCWYSLARGGLEQRHSCWRVGAQKGGYRASGRQRSLPLIWGCFSHAQKQRFKDFGLKQCTQMIRGKIGIVWAEHSGCHACGEV
jgi:hypothetical protein